MVSYLGYPDTDMYDMKYRNKLPVKQIQVCNLNSDLYKYVQQKILHNIHIQYLGGHPNM